MSILQAHLRLKFHTIGQQIKIFSVPWCKQKSPAAHGTLLRAHATTGLSYQINVILAANAYACNHLPTGLYVHAAPTQGQQGGASQNTQNKGRSPALPVQQRQISLRGQLRQRRQPR